MICESQHLLLAHVQHLLGAHAARQGSSASRTRFQARHPCPALQNWDCRLSALQKSCELHAAAQVRGLGTHVARATPLLITCFSFASKCMQHSGQAPPSIALLYTVQVTCTELPKARAGGLWGFGA